MIGAIGRLLVSVFQYYGEKEGWFLNQIVLYLQFIQTRALQDLTPKLIMSTLQQHFQNLHLIIQRGRTQASAAATVYALETYWYLGSYLSRRLSESTYGERVVQEFADWLQTVEPGIKGYDWRSLYRMREFFEQWHNMDWTIAGHTHVAMLPGQSTEDNFSEKILGSLIPKLPEMPAVLTRISWTHHLELLKRCTSPEEKLFYLILSIRERYKVRELIRQIKSSLFERQMLAKKTLLLPEHPKKDLLADIFRDIYLVEFLDVREPHSEFELKKALIANMRRFLLELGRDFIFLEEEMRLKVGMNDYAIDLVFYHRELQCLVAIDLKIEDFKPEHLGKMNFYLELLDRDVRKPHENPSIGVLLCKSKNDEVVEIAMSRQLSPMLISIYQTKFLDKKLLQRLLHDWSEEWGLQHNVDL
jgi:predicted nuclease of restriction endonuclease-like (RecB) superfamily